jgi:hypothetical protein
MASCTHHVKGSEGHIAGRMVALNKNMRRGHGEEVRPLLARVTGVYVYAVSLGHLNMTRRRPFYACERRGQNRTLIFSSYNLDRLRAS